jgi:hypothetical protein
MHVCERDSGASRDLRAGLRSAGDRSAQSTQPQCRCPSAHSRCGGRGSDRTEVGAISASFARFYGQRAKPCVKQVTSDGFLCEYAGRERDCGHESWFRRGCRAQQDQENGDGSAGQSSTGKSSTGKDLALRGGRTAVAVDADRRHGEGREPGIPRHAMRSQGDFGVAGAVGPSGVTIPVLARAKRVAFQPAELKNPGLRNQIRNSSRQTRPMTSLSDRAGSAG